MTVYFIIYDKIINTELPISIPNNWNVDLLIKHSNNYWIEKETTKF